MIKNIVFDIGQVLIKWTPFELLDDFFYDNDIIPHKKEDIKTALDAIFLTGIWDKLDEGVLEETDIFTEMFEEAPDYKREIVYVLEHIHMYAKKFDYTKDWIKKYKDKGYNVYFLSNYSAYLRRKATYLTDFTDIMDGGIFSHEVKCKKPDLKIYKIFLEKYNLKAEECIFIDDRKENVEAAKKIKFNTIEFKDYNSCVEILDAMLNKSN